MGGCSVCTHTFMTKQSEFVLSLSLLVLCLPEFCYAFKSRKSFLCKMLLFFFAKIQKAFLALEHVFYVMFVDWFCLFF